MVVSETIGSVNLIACVVKMQNLQWDKLEHACHEMSLCAKKSMVTYGL